MDASPKFWVDSTRLDQLDLVRSANRYSFKMIRVLISNCCKCNSPIRLPTHTVCLSEQNFSSSLLSFFLVISLRIVLPHIKGCLRMEDAKREKGRRNQGDLQKEGGREGSERIWRTNQIQWERDTVDWNSKCNGQVEKIRIFEHFTSHLYQSSKWQLRNDEMTRGRKLSFPTLFLSIFLLLLSLTIAHFLMSSCHFKITL